MIHACCGLVTCGHAEPRIEKSLHAGRVRCSARFGRAFLAFLPSPYQSVFGVDDLADVTEPTLGQDPCRSVLFWQRVCPDQANPAAAESVDH